MYEHNNRYVFRSKDKNCNRPNRERFRLTKGRKIGDSLSPILLNHLLEKVFRGLNWETKRININGEFKNNLRFADDIILIAEKMQELQNH